MVKQRFWEDDNKMYISSKELTCLHATKSMEGYRTVILPKSRFSLTSYLYASITLLATFLTLRIHSSCAPGLFHCSNLSNIRSFSYPQASIKMYVFCHYRLKLKCVCLCKPVGGKRKGNGGHIQVSEIFSKIKLLWVLKRNRLRKLNGIYLRDLSSRATGFSKSRVPEFAFQKWKDKGNSSRERQRGRLREREKRIQRGRKCVVKRGR